MRDWDYIGDYYAGYSEGFEELRLGLIFEKCRFDSGYSTNLGRDKLPGLK